VNAPAYQGLQNEFEDKDSVGFNAVYCGTNLVTFLKVYPLQSQSIRRNMDAAVFSKILVNFFKSVS
jgi:hypothetical protein